MIRHAVQVVSGQRAKASLGAILIGLLTAFAGPVQAADRALASVVGYSGDARYFAFEEYGIQDGSGFAYSNLYIIDLAEDRWVLGTPVQNLAGEEGETLSDIRAQTYEDAQMRLEELDIGFPAERVASNDDGVPEVTGKQLLFGIPPYAPQLDVIGHNLLTLETYPAVGGAPCQDWFDTDPKGYALTLQRGEGTPKEIHRDKALPRSRGCPEAYRISAVYLPFQATSIDNAVVLISYYPRGFEGLDRRFLAVPVRAGL